MAVIEGKPIQERFLKGEKMPKKQKDEGGAELIKELASILRRGVSYLNWEEGRLSWNEGMIPNIHLSWKSPLILYICTKKYRIVIKPEITNLEENKNAGD